MVILEERGGVVMIKSALKSVCTACKLIKTTMFILIPVAVKDEYN